MKIAQLIMKFEHIVYIKILTHIMLFIHNIMTDISKDKVAYNKVYTQYNGFSNKKPYHIIRSDHHIKNMMHYI